MLSNIELERYSRQIVRIGRKGQETLKKARVAVVGAGAVGSAISLNLACAGVGYIRIIDRDIVEPSNLSRQFLFSPADIGKPKALVASQFLFRLNPEIEVEPVVEDLNASNIEALLSGVGMVLDGLDNLEARFLTNEFCVKNKIPFVYGGAIGDSGMVTTITQKSPCFKCLLPKNPSQGSLPTCETEGVLVQATNIIGTLVSLEALKLLLGIGETLEAKVLNVSLKSLSFEKIKYKKNPNCPVCSKREFPLLSRREPQTSIVSLCGRGAFQITPARHASISLPELAKKLARLPSFRVKSFASDILSAEFEGHPIILFRSGRAIVKGAKSPGEAKSILNRILAF